MHYCSLAVVLLAILSSAPLSQAYPQAPPGQSAAPAPAPEPVSVSAPAPSASAPAAGPAPAPTASPPLIKFGYDFSQYPKQDAPPVINATWVDTFGIRSINSNVPQKLPANAIEYPACPATQDTCDWSCYKCTLPTDDLFCPSRDVWALTYDDGPSEETPALLDALKAINAKATFCVVGSRVIDRPQILRRIFEEGHQICSHTWSHRFLTSQSNEQIMAEFEWTNLIIQQVTGARPAYARPPFGDIDNRVRAVIEKMGMKTLLWNRDTLDWNLANPTTTFQSSWVLGNFTQWIAESKTSSTGFMSLEHDLYRVSAAQALLAVKLVADAKFRLQTAAECFGQRPYLSVVAVPVPNIPPEVGFGSVSPIPLPTSGPIGGNVASTNGGSSVSVGSLAAVVATAVTAAAAAAAALLVA
ncbi:hypothetical protein BC831DRAFT_441276 [Entophlyctis helioformis]|nr:hypothetical protein BC831DRAFT_441276 [Entophlyctis helioformis]